MAKKTTPNPSRNALRRFISDYLSGLDLDEPSDGRIKLRRILEEALEGLDDLDSGEVPSIFTPNLAKRQRKYPAQIRRLHIKAIVHVDALKRQHYKKGEALKAVADALGGHPRR